MSTEKLSDNKVQKVRYQVKGLAEYRDLNTKFKVHPTYGDIRPVRDIEAVKNSIRNILLTRRGERPFNPNFGCNLKAYLFEPADPITKAQMEYEIRYSIGEQEPRVKILNLDIQDDPDRNAYYITIQVLIVNNQETADVDVYLERLR